MDDQRKDFEELQFAYASLDKNPDISTITAPSKLRGQWHRKTTQRHKSSSSSSPFHSPTSTLQNPLRKENFPHTASSVNYDTLASDPSTPATPYPEKSSKTKSGSLRSEDAITISPNLGTVTYSPKNIHKKTDTAKSSQDSELCSDLAGYVHPNSPPPGSPQPNVQSTSEEGSMQVQPESNVFGRILDSDGDTLESRLSTCSSEDFATPSHTPPPGPPPPLPPKEGLAIKKSPHKASLVSDNTMSLGLNSNVEGSGSFRTTYELSLSPMEDSGKVKQFETSSKRSTLKEEDTTVSHRGDAVSDSLDDDKVQKLVSSALHSSEVQKQTASVVTSNAPSNMPRNWSETDSDDFVSSTELSRILTDLEAGKRDETEALKGTVDRMEDGRVNDEGGGVHDVQVVVDTVERNEKGVEEANDQVQKLSNGDEFTGSLTLRDEDKSVTISDMQTEEEIVTRESPMGLLDREQEAQVLQPKSGEAIPFTTPLLNGEVDREDDVQRVESCNGESPQYPTFSDDVISNGDAQQEVHPSTAAPSTTAVDRRRSSEYDESVCTSRHDSQASESPVTDTESSTPPYSDGGSMTNNIQMEEQLSHSSKGFEQLESGVKEQVQIDGSGGPEVDDTKEKSLRSELENDIYLGVSETPMDGTLTPVEMTLNIVSLRLSEYRNLSEDDGGRGEREMTAEHPKSGTAGKHTLRAGTSELIQKTLERQTPVRLPLSLIPSWRKAQPGNEVSTSLRLLSCPLLIQAEVEGLELERKCLYIQRHMNTVVVLLADKGLHQDHSILGSLVSEGVCS